MLYENIPYRSFCWVLGTTSFRTSQLSLKTEQQLRMLAEFREAHLAAGNTWEWTAETQGRFYDYMKNRGFLRGEAPNKDKDSRQKTSGLAALGLVTSDREITAAGMELLSIFDSNDLSSDNMLAIPRDSFFYLKQLLKTSVTLDSGVVRPFFVLAYLLNKFDYLTWDEFTYLLPLVSNRKSLLLVEEGIRQLRKDIRDSVDEIIFNALMVGGNYKKAQDLFIREEVTENLITTIGMNRKSRKYDLPYYDLFKALTGAFCDGAITNIETIKIYEATDKINGKAGAMWRKLIFASSTTRRQLQFRGSEMVLPDCPFREAKNLSELKIIFFKYLHLFKAKATLEDYFDLNRRYFKLTDTVLFVDHKVRFDTIPSAYFKLIGEQLQSEIFAPHPLLDKDVSFQEISSLFSYSDEAVLEHLSEELGHDCVSLADVHELVRDERYARLTELLQTRFTDDVLCELLDCFEQRNDIRIAEIVTDEATIPTIFEYVLGLIWYRLSGNKGDVLQYMKLQLDADLLPRSHAAGGDADIVYEYEKNMAYPAHSLVIEATLADNTNQRRQEMEPVSRHIGNQIAKSRNLNDYCVFVGNYLDLNTVSHFRSFKNTPYYSSRGRIVKSMKIIPLSTTHLKVFLKQKRDYSELYAEFEEIYLSDTMHAHMWLKEIEKKLKWTEFCSDYFEGLGVGRMDPEEFKKNT